MDKPPAIGIDLGTSYSCVAVFRNGKVEIIHNDLGNRTTPSVVAFTDEERLVGEVAKHQLVWNQSNTVYEIKRLVGQDGSYSSFLAATEHWPFNVIYPFALPEEPIRVKVVQKGLGVAFAPKDISAMLLSKLKETANAYLGQTVTDAVITVPVCFNTSQRQDIKDAGRIAGLNVLRIINEPTAASLAYCLDSLGKAYRKVLIYDLGGGNFNVSIVVINDGSCVVEATDGIAYLGGQDFTNRMVDHFMKDFKRKHEKKDLAELAEDKIALRRLRNACEEAKITLSGSELAALELYGFHGGIDYNPTISRTDFEKLNAVLFNKTLECIKNVLGDIKIKKEEIDDIVLVGGSTRIPKIRELIRGFFDGKALVQTSNPDETVACGAAIQAAILNGSKSVPLNRIILSDVTSHSLGILYDGRMAFLIKKNTNIPTRSSRVFSTLLDDETEFLIKVFEGERPLVSKNHLLREFSLGGTGVSRDPPGPPWRALEFCSYTR